jgi:hypothetical protein
MSNEELAFVMAAIDIKVREEEKQRKRIERQSKVRKK